MLKKNDSNLLYLIPEWALTFVGLIYATGFLIVFTFLERFGLKEAGSEFFKVKYMHVGILFLLFPIISLIPVIAIFFLKQIQKKEKFPLYLPSIILILNNLMVFYVLVAFAPPRFVMERQFVVPVLFAATFLGLAFFQYVIPLFIKEEKVATVHTVSRWLLLLVIAVPLDIYSLDGLYALLGEKLKEGGYSFLLFISLMGLVFWRVVKRSSDIPTQAGRTAFWILGACILFAVYYLAVLTFAWRVYPYMPASKGGGDFSYAPSAVFYYKEKYTKSIPSEILNKSSKLTSLSLKVIEETTNSIFVANVLEAGGPVEWRKMHSTKPSIIEIRRESIVDAVYSHDLTAP